MATKKKSLTESSEEQSEIPNEVLLGESSIEEHTEEIMSENPIYIPDIPSQGLDNSIPETPKGETEIQFLQRILNKQHEGGFGRHLDEMINDRIKELNNG